MGLTKRKNWESVLATMALKYARSPFDKESYNCAHYVCDVVAKYVVEDVKDMVGIVSLTYSEFKEMQDTKTIVDYVSRNICTRESTNMLKCSRGDILCYNDVCLGVCVGGYGVFIGECDSVINIPVSECSCFWRVN